MSREKFLRDVVITVKANDYERVTRIGDFIMVKEGEELEVLVEGNRNTVESGDTLEFPFTYKEFQIVNKTDYDQRVILSAGFGRFERPIVKGTVRSVQGIIGADGRSLSDDRITESVNLAITDSNTFSWSKNDILSEGTHNRNFSNCQSAYYDKGANEVVTINGSSSVKLTRLDADTFAVNSESGVLNDDGKDHVCVDPYRQMATDFGSPNVLYTGVVGALTSTMTATNLVNNTGFDVDRMGAFYDYVTDKTFIIFTRTDHKEYLYCTIDSSGDITELKHLTNNAGLVGDPKGFMRYTADENETLFQLETSGGGATINFETQTIEAGAPWGFLVKGSAYDFDENFYIELAKIGGPNDARKRVIYDADYSGYGFVTIGSCRPLEILNRGSIAKISADVTLTQQGRSVKIEGELIKALLELYAAKVGGAVPSNYLDFIYGIKGAGLNTFSGDESFERVGINDNFSVVSPTALSLTFSKRLLAQ